MAFMSFGRVAEALDLSKEAERRATAIDDIGRKVAAMAFRASAQNFYGTPLEAIETSEQVVDWRKNGVIGAGSTSSSTVLVKPISSPAVISTLTVCWAGLCAIDGAGGECSDWRHRSEPASHVLHDEEHDEYDDGGTRDAEEFQGRAEEWPTKAAGRSTTWWQPGAVPPDAGGGRSGAAASLSSMRRSRWRSSTGCGSSFPSSLAIAEWRISNWNDRRGSRDPRPKRARLPEPSAINRLAALLHLSCARSRPEGRSARAR